VLGFKVTGKIEWALQRGGRSAHPFSWLLSSPQQPLETEDPPTVSLAPQYTSQRLCRAIEFFGGNEVCENSKIFEGGENPNLLTVKLFHSAVCKFFSILSNRPTALTSILQRLGTDFVPDCPGELFRVSGNLTLVFAFDHNACQRLGS